MRQWNEIAQWLKQVKNTAPDEVFNGMMQLAEDELPYSRYRIVTESLTEGGTLA